MEACRFTTMAVGRIFSQKSAASFIGLATAYTGLRSRGLIEKNDRPDSKVSLYLDNVQGYGRRTTRLASKLRQKKGDVYEGKIRCFIFDADLVRLRFILGLRPGPGQRPGNIGWRSH